MRNAVLGVLLVMLLGTETALYAADESAATQKEKVPSAVVDWIARIQKRPEGPKYDKTLDGGDFWEVRFNDPGCESGYCADGYYLVRIDKKTHEICYSDRAGAV